MGNVKVLKLINFFKDPDTPKKRRLQMRDVVRYARTKGVRIASMVIRGLISKRRPRSGFFAEDNRFSFVVLVIYRWTGKEPFSYRKHKKDIKKAAERYWDEQVMAGMNPGTT